MSTALPSSASRYFFNRSSTRFSSLARALAADVVAIAELLQRQRLLREPALAKDRLLATLEGVRERLELALEELREFVVRDRLVGTIVDGKNRARVRAPPSSSPEPSARRARLRARRAGAPSSMTSFSGTSSFSASNADDVETRAARASRAPCAG